VLPDGVSQCPTCGLFQPGNTTNLVNGLRSERMQLAMLPGQETVARVMAAKRQAVYVDLGGGPDGEHLTEVLKTEIDRWCKLCVLEATLWDNLEKCGALTGRGKRRAALNAYLAVNDRIGFAAQRIGIQRHTKRVDLARVLSGLDRPHP
jgi:hypothetical protein